MTRQRWLKKERRTGSEGYLKPDGLDLPSKPGEEDREGDVLAISLFCPKEPYSGPVQVEKATGAMEAHPPAKNEQGKFECLLVPASYTGGGRGEEMDIGDWGQGKKRG